MPKDKLKKEEKQPPPNPLHSSPKMRGKRRVTWCYLDATIAANEKE